MGRTPESDFERYVKRSFARALAVRIRGQYRHVAAKQGGVSRAYLQKLLNGESAISLPRFIRLAEQMNIPPGDLLTETMANLERMRQTARDAGTPPSSGTREDP